MEKRRIARAIGGTVSAGAMLLALAGAPAEARQQSSQSSPAPDAPLIDDAEFSRDLPPLDADSAISAGSVSVPAPATSASVPAASAAPDTAADQALAQPLAPLAGFDATPPAATPDVADSQPTRVRYRVAIEGLKPVGLEDEFRQFSALVDGGKKAANAAQVSARANEDVKLAERLLHSEGYFDATASSVTSKAPNGAGELLVTLTAVPGQRYKLGTVAVTGAAPEPEGLARTALGLTPGNPIRALEVEGGEANVSLRLPEQGFPFVTLGDRDVLLDPATAVGDYTLPVDAGPKARYGALRTEGDPVFGVDHLAVFPRFKRGQVYDSRKVDDMRQALVATSLFSSIAVQPVRTGQVNEDGTETVDLLVTQHRGPSRNLAGSAGYATGEGVKLTGSWTNRNLFPPEGALTVAAVAGTQEQSLSGVFTRSNAGKRDRTFSIGASAARQRFDAYNAETFDLTANIARQSTPIWQKRWTYSIGGEVLATRETGFTGETADGRNGSTYFIVALPGQLGYDRSNSLLDPTAGFRINGRLSPEAQKQSGGGFDGYARLLLEGSGYYPATDSLVIAGRARVGSILGVARDDIAPSRRLYAGGGGSVRGFGFQELGPKDADGDPVGGRGLTEFALEARYRFGNYGVVPFVDAGQLTERSTPSVSNLRYGLGIGARYYTNFGPFRLDVATPLNRQRGESKVALYISIGQAF